TQGFAVATGYDSTTGRYIGLALPHEDTPPQLTDSTLLVRPDLARAQRDAERPAAAAAAAARRAAEDAKQAGGAGTGTSGGDGTNTDGDGGTGADTRRPTRTGGIP